MAMDGDNDIDMEWQETEFEQALKEVVGDSTTAVQRLLDPGAERHRTDPMRFDRLSTNREDYRQWDMTAMLLIAALFQVEAWPHEGGECSYEASAWLFGFSLTRDAELTEDVLRRRYQVGCMLCSLAASTERGQEWLARLNRAFHILLDGLPAIGRMRARGRCRSLKTLPEFYEIDPSILEYVSEDLQLRDTLFLKHSSTLTRPGFRQVGIPSTTMCQDTFRRLMAGGTSAKELMSTFPRMAVFAPELKDQWDKLLAAMKSHRKDGKSAVIYVAMLLSAPPFLQTGVDFEDWVSRPAGAPTTKDWSMAVSTTLYRPATEVVTTGVRGGRALSMRFLAVLQLSTTGGYNHTEVKTLGPQIFTMVTPHTAVLVDCMRSTLQKVLLLLEPVVTAMGLRCQTPISSPGSTPAARRMLILVDAGEYLNALDAHLLLKRLKAAVSEEPKVYCALDSLIRDEYALEVSLTASTALAKLVPFAQQLMFLGPDRAIMDTLVDGMVLSHHLQTQYEEDLSGSNYVAQITRRPSSELTPKIYAQVFTDGAVRAAQLSMSRGLLAHEPIAQELTIRIKGMVACDFVALFDQIFETITLPNVASPEEHPDDLYLRRHTDAATPLDRAEWKLDGDLEGPWNRQVILYAGMASNAKHLIEQLHERAVPVGRNFVELVVSSPFYDVAAIRAHFLRLRAEAARPPPPRRARGVPLVAAQTRRLRRQRQRGRRRIWMRRRIIVAVRSMPMGVELLRRRIRWRL